MILMSRNERYKCLVFIILGVLATILGVALIDLGPQGLIGRILSMAGGGVIGICGTLLIVDEYEKIKRLKK